MSDYRIKPGTMQGWTDRKTGESSTFLAAATRAADQSQSLIWYVNPASRWPVWAQLLWLNLKVHVLRREP